MMRNKPRPTSEPGIDPHSKLHFTAPTLNGETNGLSIRQRHRHWPTQLACVAGVVDQTSDAGVLRPSSSVSSTVHVGNFKLPVGCTPDHVWSGAFASKYMHTQTQRYQRCQRFHFPAARLDDTDAPVVPDSKRPCICTLQARQRKRVPGVNHNAREKQSTCRWDAR
ncbi:hypothetical protein BKA80DRAFT_278548 [Phyllosticta citrichinensis]